MKKSDKIWGPLLGILLLFGACAKNTRNSIADENTALSSAPAKAAAAAPACHRLSPNEFLTDCRLQWDAFKHRFQSYVGAPHRTMSPR